MCLTERSNQPGPVQLVLPQHFHIVHALPRALLDRLQLGAVPVQDHVRQLHQLLVEGATLGGILGFGERVLACYCVL